MFKLREKRYIPLKPSIRNNAIITSYEDRGVKTFILIAKINAKQEDSIDNKQSIRIVDINLDVTVEPKDVLCYGEVDFLTDTLDLDVISKLDWKCLYMNPVWIVGNYNYEDHSTISIDDNIRYFDCTNPELIIPYLHGYIGKPKRICIFKYKIK